jgi:hypothetical protein
MFNSILMNFRLRAMKFLICRDDHVIRWLTEPNLDDLNMFASLEYLLHSIRTEKRFQFSLLLLIVTVQTLAVLGGGRDWKPNRHIIPV